MSNEVSSKVGLKLFEVMASHSSDWPGSYLIGADDRYAIIEKSDNEPLQP